MKLQIKVTYKIRSARKERGMTLKELSNLSGVSISEINDIERNLHDATVTTLCYIAVALGVKPQELFVVELIDKK